MSASTFLSFKNPKTQRGVTLIELVVSIVVLSIAAVGIYSTMGFINKTSPDAMLRSQAISIATAYIEEIQSKPFLDPTTNTWCGGAAPGTRAAYDDICDYQNLADNTVRDFNGSPVTELSDYQVAVVISSNAAVLLNGLTGGVTPNLARIDITVTDVRGFELNLSSYRTRY